MENISQNEPVSRFETTWEAAPAKKMTGDVDDMIFDGEDWHCSER